MANAQLFRHSGLPLVVGAGAFVTHQAIVAVLKPRAIGVTGLVDRPAHEEPYQAAS